MRQSGLPAGCAPILVMINSGWGAKPRAGRDDERVVDPHRGSGQTNASYAPARLAIGRLVDVATRGSAS